MKNTEGEGGVRYPQCTIVDNLYFSATFHRIS